LLLPLLFGSGNKQFLMTSLVTPTSQRTSVDNFVILQPFKSWLINKNYSPATIRNYLSDVNAYFDFASNRDIFSSNFLTEPPKTWDELAQKIPLITQKDEAGKINQTLVALGTTNNISYPKYPHIDIGLYS
jgi:hypothetical protein